MSGSVLIVGIDPGSLVTGYGIIDNQGLRNKYVTSGCIRVRGACLTERLSQIYRALQLIISEHGPIEAAIEEVFMQQPGPALKLGQARGAAIVALAGIPIAEYSARQIKQSVVGHGNASKLQVQHMVKALLNLKVTLTADAADALAVALCHSNIRHSLQRMPGIKGISRGRLR